MAKDSASNRGIGRAGAALLLVLLAAASLGGCSLCERDASADGTYDLLTDCGGSGMVNGMLSIGPYGAAPPTYTSWGTTQCVAPGSVDAGVHPSQPPGDGGSTTPAACTTDTTNFETEGCSATAAAGAAALGLPSQVKVNGDRDFDLFGDVNGKNLDCQPARFGDEKILLCSSGGHIVCAAVIQNVH